MSWQDTIQDEPAVVQTPSGTWRDTIQQEAPAPIPPSKADSAMRGAAKGATFGFADEAYGALGALANPADIPHDPGLKGWIEGIPDRYAASRDYARQKDAEAQKANPVTFGVSELAGGLATPGAAGIGAKALGGTSAAGSALGAVRTALVAPEEAGVLANVGRGIGQGALFGAGNSDAHPFQSPDEAKHFAEDVGGGAALGGILGGTGKVIGMGLSKLTPDSLNQIAEEQLLNAATGQTEKGAAQAALLGHADEAGDPAVGWLSGPKKIASNIAAKQQYYEDSAAYSAKALDDITPGAVDNKALSKSIADKAAAMPKTEGSKGQIARLMREAQTRSQGDPISFSQAEELKNTFKPGDPLRGIYEQNIDQAAQKVQSAGGTSGDFAAQFRSMKAKAAAYRELADAGTSTESSTMRPRSIRGAAKSVAFNVLQNNGPSFAGRTAQAGADVLKAAPETIGTAAGAARQYLDSGLGAQALTHEILDTPESAAAIKRQRLRQAMIRQLGNLKEQGYGQQQMP